MPQNVRMVLIKQQMAAASKKYQEEQEVGLALYRCAVRRDHATCRPFS